MPLEHGARSAPAKPYFGRDASPLPLWSERPPPVRKYATNPGALLRLNLITIEPSVEGYVRTTGVPTLKMAAPSSDEPSTASHAELLNGPAPAPRREPEGVRSRIPHAIAPC